MSKFRHLPEGVIEIDGEKFDLDLFLEVEPEYTFPDDMRLREYDGRRHIIYLKDNQIQGELPWKDGDRYLTRIADLNLLQKTIEDDVKYVQGLKKPKEPELGRESEYPHIKELIIAMWELFVEGQPKETTINIVQEKRLKVKEKYPK